MLISGALSAHELYVLDPQGQGYLRVENGWIAVPVPEHPVEVEYRKHIPQADRSGMIGVIKKGLNPYVLFQSPDGKFYELREDYDQLIASTEAFGFYARTVQGEIVRIVSPEPGSDTFEITSVAPKYTAWNILAVTRFSVVVESLKGEIIELDTRDSARVGLRPVVFPDGGRRGVRSSTSTTPGGWHYIVDVRPALVPDEPCHLELVN